ncbi:hypothetical protein WN51_02524 [Melipona quadrifasciata]|uniref:Uncharacterized protein n=1 Tax=Melipona quadrifasciata TaxID=166423 RepID=A0A0N0BDH5_9HYME|nr:hypothetical protein WN51_02524 [Melipona quadrifasciata]
MPGGLLLEMYYLGRAEVQCFILILINEKDSLFRRSDCSKKEIAQIANIYQKILKTGENTVELVSNLLSVISSADHYCVRAGQESLFSRYGAHNELCEARTMIYSTIPVIERLSGTKGTL